jgi:hypothetical protein
MMNSSMVCVDELQEKIDNKVLQRMLHNHFA